MKIRKEPINLFTYPLIKFKSAFTLAEVLITLGIIGVVAAMTIPTLMTKYQKHRTETQLIKFYSMMNQTLRMSVAENGDPEGWITRGKDYTYEENVEFLNTYILPYIKNLGYKECTPVNCDGTLGRKRPCVTLLDGSILTFKIDIGGGDLTYITEEKYLTNNKNLKRHKFHFQFAKRSNRNTTEDINSLNHIEPYILNWDGTREYLKNDSEFGCNDTSASAAYCTKLIQMNSWKIPSDYPW